MYFNTSKLDIAKARACQGWKSMYKRVLNQDCSVKPFIGNISSLYIIDKLYSIKSSSSYHVDVPSHKEMVIVR